MNIQKETLRVTILAVILALLFGLSQYLPLDQTFSQFDLIAILVLVVKTMQYLAPASFLIYFIFLGLSLTSDERAPLNTKWADRAYDYSIIIVFMILFFDIGLVLWANIINYCGSSCVAIGSYSLGGMFILWLLAFMALIGRTYPKKYKF